MEKENLFIFVSDALRYDYLPQSIANSGTVLKTLAPSLHTPVSFSSLITCKSPKNHNVRGFSDALNQNFETVFDRFENGTYFDHPKDPMRNIVLKETPKKKELEEIKEPFCYIERGMDTHQPYGKMEHGNELLEHKTNDPSKVRAEENIQKKYKKGVKKAERHFWEHVKKLEKLGLKENTLIVFTSDHGELLGERINLRKRYAHAHPMSKELAIVPTVFYKTNLQNNLIRTIDIVETSLGIMEGEYMHKDGLDIRKNPPKKGNVIIDGYASYNNIWKNSGENWVINKTKLSKDILREDIRILLSKLNIDFIDRPGRNKNNIALEIDF